MLLHDDDNHYDDDNHVRGDRALRVPGPPVHL
jgi:hypothetical protein